MAVTTPWGPVSHRTSVYDGIAFYSTPSHGGYHVNPMIKRLVDEAYPERLGQPFYHGGRWFEEDCEWAYLAKVVPEAFPPGCQGEADTVIEWLRKGKVA